MHEIYRQHNEPIPNNLKQSDIKLYFFCKNGKRWYFEGGQRICHIIQEQYWSIEKTFIPVKPQNTMGLDDPNMPEGAGNGHLPRSWFDFENLEKTYRRRELTELERIYVMFKRDYDQSQ